MGRGIGIFELVRDAKGLEAGAFEAKYGSFFLIRTLDDGSLSPSPVGFSKTTTQIVDAAEMVKQGAKLENPEASYVYPVVPRVPGEAVIVGRKAESDICIDDKSLSKEHAQLFVRSDGTLAIIDKESKNGTRIGKVRIEPGLPTPVQFGKTIMFGAVRLTYLPVRQLMDFVRVTFDDDFANFVEDDELGLAESVDIDVDIDVDFD